MSITNKFYKLEIIMFKSTFAKAVIAALLANAVASIENATVIGTMSGGSISLIVAAVAISSLVVAFGSKVFIKLIAAFPRIPFFGGLSLAGLGVFFTVKALVL